MVGIYNISMFSGVKVIDISGDYATTQYYYNDKKYKVTKNKIRYNKEGQPYFKKYNMIIYFSDCMAV